MSLIAGFMMPTHPLARGPAVMTLSPGLSAVALPATDNVRIERYRTATQWCAAGPFLPVPWQFSIREAAFDALAAGATERLRLAVVEIGSIVEMAFRLDLRALDEGVNLDLPAPVSGGRAYLRSLQSTYPSTLARLRRRLQGVANDLRFDLPSVRIEQAVVEGILSCALTDADSFSSILAELAAAGSDQGVVEGPLPPFGTATRSLASVGFQARRKDS